MKYWWLKLARYAVPQWRSLLLIGVLMLIGVAAGLLAPWPMKLIVDYVLYRKPLPEQIAWAGNFPGAKSATGQLAWFAAATVAFFLVGRIISVLQSYIQAGASSRMVYGLATDLFMHTQRQSMRFHNKHRAGDLIRRITADTACVRELVIHVCLPLITAVVTLISMFVVMWHLSAGLALFAMGLMVPLIAVVKFFARPMSERKYREWELQGEISSLAEQTLSAIPVVQAFGREDREDDRFRQIAKRSLHATLQSEFSQHQFRVGTGTVTAFGAAVVMVVGGVSVLQGSLSVGSLLVLIAYFAALYSPIETLAYLPEGYASAAAGARRVFEILDVNDHTVIDLPNARALLRNDHSTGISVRFENVVCGYEPRRPVLHEISLLVGAGEKVALVGATGAGKSTLVSLIPRLIDPWEGAVFLGDADIRQLTVASVRENVAMVLQEPFLLPLSIAENIAYARPQANREEIIAAAVAAEADAFIERLPQGYDTVIGERGVTLSGGEKQRLSIARALLKDAPVLILDEPTSAVDARTEASLVSALERLLAGRTTIIIAHRLSTIRNADRIVVLENGRIVEVGRHEELLLAGGVYRSFFNRQLGSHVAV